MRIARAAAAAALVAAVASCSSIASRGVDPSEVTLDGVMWAMYLSPQSNKIGAPFGPDQGYVLLVREDGEYTTIETSGMDTNTLVWDRHGLAFSDRDADYRLTDDGLRVVPSPKSSSQNALFSTEDGTLIGVYNDGFAEDGGYVDQVVTTDADGAILAEVEGNYWITAMCDGDVYGVGLATGPYASEANPERVVLARLSGTDDGAERVVGTSEDAPVAAVSPDTPCRDGSLFYIDDAGTGALGATPHPVLVEWDVETGEHRRIDLVDEEGAPVPMRDDGLGWPRFTAASLVGNDLEWFGAGNAIMSTDVTTGVTTHRFDVAARLDDVADSQAAFTESTVGILVANNDGTDVRCVDHDRATGEMIRNATVPDVVDELGVDLVIRGFAIRP